MRKRNYHVGYDKELVVVKGRINKFTDLNYDDDKGMMITAELDDTLPMVEYGVIAWPVNEEIPEDHQIKIDHWELFGSATGWEEDRIWNYYISKPVQTFTKDEVQEMFDKYFAPFIKEGNGIGDGILKEFYKREEDTRNI